MDFYELLKSLHVLGAVVWIGGGLATTVLMANLRADGDPVALSKTLGHMSKLGQRLFMPASLLLILTGFGMVGDADLEFEFWIVIALVAWLASAVNGAAFMGPQSGKLAEALSGPAPDMTAVDERLKRVITVGSIEVLILLLVVVDMIVKPTL